MSHENDSHLGSTVIAGSNSRFDADSSSALTVPAAAGRSKGSSRNIYDRTFTIAHRYTPAGRLPLGFNLAAGGEAVKQLSPMCGTPH
jgi:hypothetical protein